MTEQQTVVPIIAYDGVMQPPPRHEIVLPPRPMVDPQVLKDQNRGPDQTPEEDAEQLSLLGPQTRIYHQGVWLVLDLTLRRLRQDFAMYCGDLQDRSDEQWRSTGAYRRAHDQARARLEEEASERRWEREKESRRATAADRRMQELIEYGLSVHEARAQVAAEFPDQ